MSITFTDQLDKPSEITTIPNQLLRPVFGALYGFDIPVSGGGGTPAIFNVTTRDTEANILASTPTNPSGEVNIAFGTDTYDFYIYSGGAWYIYNNDTNFNDSLVFPTIEVFDNESDFISDTGADDYTIVHAKDTDRLYVWEGSAWYLYNNNSTV